MEDFYKTDIIEQETIINVDYYEKKVHLYTSRNMVYKRYLKLIGKPNIEYHTNSKISGARWEIDFSNKRLLNSILSRPLLIGNIGKKRNEAEI